MTLDLMSPAPFGPTVVIDGPLALSSAALQRTFRELVEKKGLQISAVSEARLTFTFSPDPRDDYNCAVQSVLTTDRGSRYEHALDRF